MKRKKERWAGDGPEDEKGGQFMTQKSDEMGAVDTPVVKMVMRR